MSGPRTVVLMYHRVAEAGASPEEGDYVLPTPLFEEQMRALAGSRQPALPLYTLLEADRPDGAVVITFDDGCASDATVAGPLLRALGLPGAFFVNPARVGEPGRASWDELRALAEDGFAIGSHGVDHTLFDGLTGHQLERQLVDSRRCIEQRLGRPVDALSLPGGSGGPRARRAAFEAGYRLVLGSRPAVLRGPAAGKVVPRFALRRSGGRAGFDAAVAQRPGFLLRQALRYRLASTGRALIGARAYSRLRELWLDHARQARRA